MLPIRRPGTYEKLLLQYYVNNRYSVVSCMSRNSELSGLEKNWETHTGSFPTITLILLEFATYFRYILYIHMVRTSSRSLAAILEENRKNHYTYRNHVKYIYDTPILGRSNILADDN